MSIIHKIMAKLIFFQDLICFQNHIISKQYVFWNKRSSDCFKPFINFQNSETVVFDTCWCSCCLYEVYFFRNPCFTIPELHPQLCIGRIWPGTLCKSLSALLKMKGSQSQWQTIKAGKYYYCLTTAWDFNTVWGEQQTSQKKLILEEWDSHSGLW